MVRRKRTWTILKFVMDSEAPLIFSVYSSNGRNCLFTLSRYDIVGSLKEKIEEKLQIPRSRLTVTGWRLPPDDDCDMLKICSNCEDINFLHVKERSFETRPVQKTTVNEELELEACMDFIKEVMNNISENVITFHVDLLRNKIAEVCLGPQEQRRVLLLYLHNKYDEFSNIFWRNMRRPEVIDVVKKKCCIMGWDLSNPKHQSALVDALNKNSLIHITPFIQRKSSALVCIISTKINGREEVYVMSCMRKTTSDADFLNCLENAATCQVLQKTVANDEKIVINSRVIQQKYADLLSDRDYDGYEFNEHEHLKTSIAYAICGPPTDENGYDEKIQNEANRLFVKILSKNNEVAQYKDKVEVAVIYNCTEPLPKAKQKKLKTNPKYKPEEDIIPYPVFIVRKCHESENPCRIFIDHVGRVYTTWREYLFENKLPKCIMNVPKNGRYEVDKDENVILEQYYSPACGMGTKVLNGLDIASAVGGLASGGVGVATSILGGTALVASTPLLAAALPVVGIGAMVTGGVVGIYSIVRSSMTIHDKRIREEPLGFFENSEARSAYLNIVAGGLGFIGAGTNAVVSQLVSRGVQFGTSAKMAVNAINVINLGAGGVSVGNSIHEVVSQYLTTQEVPSALQILQLSTNILFFGHAVFTFRTAGRMIDETQARVLQEYNDSLRSNRHRKTFDKILRETVKRNEGNSAHGKAEVISALRNIQNKDETFAALTRTLGKLSKKGVRVSAGNGEILFNGVSVDMAEFSNIRSNEVNAFLAHLSAKTDVSPREVSFVQSALKSSQISIPNVYDLAKFAAKFLINFSGDIKEKIIMALTQVLDVITGPFLQELEEILPKNRKYYELFQVVMKFFSNIANNMEEQYQRWKATKSPQYFNPLFDHIDPEKAKRYVELVSKAVALCFEFKYMKGPALQKLVSFCIGWITQKVHDYQEEKERKEKRVKHSAGARFKASPVTCKDCGGFYFQNTSV